MNQERIGGGEIETAPEAERIGAQELGAKVLDVAGEVEDGAKGRFEQKEGSNRTLDEAVFDHVDLREVERVTSEYTKKIDLKELLDLCDGLKEDIEVGAYKAGNYFTNLLGLRRQPTIDLEAELPEDILGKCVQGWYMGIQIMFC